MVFMSTVLGTILLSGGRADPSEGGHRWSSFDPVADSAMGLLNREMEFEYLAIGAGFVQGLINWLAAICLRFLVQIQADRRERAQRPVDSSKTRLVDIESQQFHLGISLSIAALVLFLLSFYNQHLDFNGNYFHVIKRLSVLFFAKYVTPASSYWPPQPIPLLILPILVAALWFFAQSFVVGFG